MNSPSPMFCTGDNHAAHCLDWVRASMGGAPARSNFGIADRYTEWLLVGEARIRQGLGDQALNPRAAGQWPGRPAAKPKNKFALRFRQ